MYRVTNDDKVLYKSFIYSISPRVRDIVCYLIGRQLTFLLS